MKKKSFNCRFGKIKGLCWGEGNQKKMLALHGWLDNAASFCELAPKLANLGYEVIAIDFSGHGKSTHRAEGHFAHFVDFVLDIQNIIIELNWQKLTLVGHSMGAAMAQFYAIGNIEKVEKLIMIENLGPIPAYEPGSIQKNITKSLEQWKNHTTNHRHFYKTVDLAIQTRLKATPMAVEIIKPMVKRGLKKTKKGYHWRTDKRLRLQSLLRFSEETIQDALESEKPPTQLILATPVTSAMNYISAKQRKNKLNAESYIEIKGHHHLHMDKAEEVFKSIKIFLNK